MSHRPAQDVYSLRLRPGSGAAEAARLIVVVMISTIPIVPVPVMESIVTPVELVVAAIVLTLDVAMEPTMLPASETLMVGSVMESLEPVVAVVMPVFEPVMLPIVSIARPVAVRHGRCGQA